MAPPAPVATPPAPPATAPVGPPPPTSAAPAAAARRGAAGARDDQYNQYLTNQKKQEEKNLRDRKRGLEEATKHYARQERNLGVSQDELKTQLRQGEENRTTQLPKQKKLIVDKNTEDKRAIEAQRQQLAAEHERLHKNDQVYAQRADLVRTRREIAERKDGFYRFAKVWEMLQEAKRRAGDIVANMYKAFNSLNAAALQVQKISGGLTDPAPQNIPAEPGDMDGVRTAEKELTSLKTQNEMERIAYNKQSMRYSSSAEQVASEFKRQLEDHDLKVKRLESQMQGVKEQMQQAQLKIAHAKKDREDAEKELEKFKKENPKVA